VSPAAFVEKVSRGCSVAFVFIAATILPTGIIAQEIPRDEYFSYVPLEVPVAIRQTAASGRLHLFGDPSAPGYRDSDLDGIDDARAELLASLALRFAPLLVMNSTAVPLDLVHTTSEEGAFPIIVDLWQNDRPGGRFAGSDTTDVLEAASEPCTDGDPEEGYDKSDCRLRRLLTRYSLDSPEGAAERVAARLPGESFHEVLWVDYPGRSADDWNRIYRDKNGELPARFRDLIRTYVHPFITEVREEGEPASYELVLQYWFFYPWNDGGNNHLGDWEHLNVVVSPLRSVDRAQTEAELLALLDGLGSGVESGPDQLVIRRLDYYFHSKVWTLDFAQPNAYAPRATWEEEVRRRARDRGGEAWLWRVIRERAWADEAETRINTRPVGWIGADNKGLDQLLSPPGGTNRDSHGTFAMPGLYKEIGPAGAVESISVGFDPRDYWAASARDRLDWTERWKRKGVVDLAEPGRIVLLPDVDRIAPLLEVSAPTRAGWSWLVLPVRFGYPAVESPFAGIVSHAETGNLAVLGPAFNAGWNRSGESEGFSAYEPDKVPRLLPLAWQDNFINSWGWLNLTAPTIAMFPPIDFLWRVVALPFRAILQPQDPTFYPVERLPLRYVGAGSGYSRMTIDAEAYTELLINSSQFDELVARLILYGLINGTEETTITGIEEFADAAESPFFLVSFFVGDRFVSENVLRHSRSALGFDVSYSDVPPQTIRGELNFWEYSGSFRYDVTTGSVRLFPKAGYGLSWYRIENLAADGDPFENPDSEWVRQPSLFDNLLPNTWHAGAGLEWLVLKNYAVPPRGLDLSVRIEWTWYTNKLGLDTGDLPLETLVDLGVSADQLPRDRWVGRTELRLGATLSF
jgi:hypothetical protein